MIIPAFATGPAGTAAELVAKVTRASVLGRVRVCLGTGNKDAALQQEDFKSSAAAALIRAAQGGLVVGPFNVAADQAALEAVERACVGWLNEGAFAVVLSGTPAACMVLAERLPRSRTYYSATVDMTEPSKTETCKRLQAMAGKGCFGGFEFHVAGSDTTGNVDVTALRASVADQADEKHGYGLGYMHEVLIWYGRGVRLAAEDIGTLGRNHGVHVVSYNVTGLSETEEPDSAAASAAASSPSKSVTPSFPPLNAGLALVACLRTDRPDGLFTTVVCDECGVALGLVYSSAESVLESLRTGRGVYYSRSRKGLWRKGATSGAIQELVSVRFDCDSDALRFCVRQKGSPPSFCHTGNRTCWGPAEGLRHLQETLQSRLVTAPSGSYTKRLFDDAALLRNKLLEEAQELSEAAEPDHVAAEAADVIYFAMVAAVKGGADLEAIERHLNARTLKIKRRPGNAKPERIAAAAAELDQIRAKKKRKVSGEGETNEESEK